SKAASSRRLRKRSRSWPSVRPPKAARFRWRRTLFIGTPCVGDTGLPLSIARHGGGAWMFFQRGPAATLPAAGARHGAARVPRPPRRGRHQGPNVPVGGWERPSALGFLVHERRSE